MNNVLVNGIFTYLHVAAILLQSYFFLRFASVIPLLDLFIAQVSDLAYRQFHNRRLWHMAQEPVPFHQTMTEDIYKHINKP
ncbi:hypothetical protein ccbrp13_18690 [Ktedonobacteria bacterium brp13]|nr:hypothetical protein ccbrp13_18690 [Ktedonobacteria bacterium brp13]